MFGVGGSGTPASTGAKFSVSGDILTLTSSVVQDKVLDMVVGESVTRHETAQVVATLLKK